MSSLRLWKDDPGQGGLLQLCLTLLFIPGPLSVSTTLSQALQDRIWDGLVPSSSQTPLSLHGQATQQHLTYGATPADTFTEHCFTTLSSGQKSVCNVLIPISVIVSCCPKCRPLPYPFEDAAYSFRPESEIHFLLNTIVTVRLAITYRLNNTSLDASSSGWVMRAYV